MDETPAQKFGYFIAGIGIIIPSMIVSGFMPLWDVLPFPVWLLITGGLGGVGMAVAHQPRVASMIGGAVAGVCIPFALIGYVELRIMLSDTFLNVELVIPGIIGALPGFGLYKLISSAVDSGSEKADDVMQPDDTEFDEY